jgi:hypothetical protein
MSQMLLPLRKRDKPKPNYVKIAQLEEDLGLPSTVSTELRERSRYAVEWTRSHTSVRHGIRKGPRNLLIGLTLFFVVLGGFFYVMFYTEAFTQTPRSLPPGVFVGPNATYVVPPDEGGLGAVLCDDSSFSTATLGKHVLVNCTEGSPKFKYPISRIWDGPT